jgi:hypothetical protein
MFVYIYIYTHTYTYTNNCTIIRQNVIQTRGKIATYFGLFRPYSGTYSTKKNTVMASYVKRMQQWS